MNAIETIPSAEDKLRSRAERAVIDAAASGPVLHFFISALVWLLAGSALALMASIKLHSPTFLADADWLTFGRVRPAHLTTMVYGWASMACIGVSIWIMSRLCRAPLRGSGWLHLSAVLLNAGNLVGTYGILMGHSMAFEWLEYPREAGVLITLAFVPLMAAFASMARRRQPGHIYVSQWYLMASIFWFPWLYLTTQVLLLWNPVAAPAQPPINWWYAHNVLGLWFTPVCLAAAYYLIPKVLGRPIHSYYLSIVGFWSLAFFYAWNGMHHLIGGPYPGWLISVSIVASLMMFIPVITVAVNHHSTVWGSFRMVKSSPTLRFVVFAAMCYTLVSIQGSLMAVRSLNHVTHFTHYTIAHSHLGMYAFVTMMLFGAMYYMMPRLTGREWPSPVLISIHFWCCALGVLHYFAVLTVAGIKEGLWLLDENVAFIDIVRAMLPYLEQRSWAGSVMTVGHLAFTVSFFWLLVRKPAAESKATLLATLAPNLPVHA
ncbi:MAG: rane protein [Verrucomicrobiaceae bacterium]|nr:rane protein [Verrucomicrobiaceae bacterium]